MSLGITPGYRHKHGFGAGLGGFGNAFGMQGEKQEEAKVPAKFKSFTVVTLDKPAATPAKTAKK